MHLTIKILSLSRYVSQPASVLHWAHNHSPFCESVTFLWDIKMGRKISLSSVRLIIWEQMINKRQTLEQIQYRWTQVVQKKNYTRRNIMVTDGDKGWDVVIGYDRENDDMC